MKRIKVLFIVEAMGGGIFTYVVNLTNQLADKFELYVAYGLRDQTPVDYKDYFDPRIHLIRVENFTRSVSIKKDMLAFAEIRRIAKGIQPDIIHLHSSKAGALGRWAFDGRRVPLFYTPHGYSFLMNDHSAVHKAVYYTIEKLSSMRRCTTISCGPGEDQQTRKMTSRAKYVRNGIHTKEIDALLDGAEPAAHPFTVFTLGRICPQKNPALFNEIALKAPDVHFLWIGKGELRHELTAPNITVTGWMPRREALNKAMQADAFILTSRWEGLPISLLEAMYMRKLCIVSDIPGNNDVIRNGENGFLCRTADEFVQALRTHMGQKQTEMIERAYDEIMQTYNLDVMAKAYEEIYMQAVRSRG